jgi:hypothetical protein
VRLQLLAVHIRLQLEPQTWLDTSCFVDCRHTMPELVAHILPTRCIVAANPSPHWHGALPQRL